MMAENRYHEAMGEIGELACVGAGIGGGFMNTNELHVMKFDEAMATADKDKWQKVVDEEHDCMTKCNMWKPVKIKEVPEGAKVISSTWVMKKKANGVHHAHVNARGFEQVDSEHYDSQMKGSPVVSHVMIMIMLIIMLMAGMYSHLLDVNGAFLLGQFNHGKTIYMGMPQGFEKYYPSNVVLLLLQTLYGLIQAAIAFWKKLCKVFKLLGYKQSQADPCLYYHWKNGKLIMWASWVNDLITCGYKSEVLNEVDHMKQQFDCDDGGKLNEYVGCKIEHNQEEGWLKLTQPVLLQSFEDEFRVTKEGKAVMTLAALNTVLKEHAELEQVSNEMKTQYCKGISKFLHLMKWS